jgi:hypothetical protein
MPICLDPVRLSSQLWIVSSAQRFEVESSLLHGGL